MQQRGDRSWIWNKGTKLDGKMDIQSYFTDEVAQSYRPQVTEQSCRPSSSSSSMPSFSTSSPECSSFLINVASNSAVLSDPFFPEASAIQPIPTQSVKNGHSYSRLRETQFPWQRSNEDSTMTQAILAVLSSSQSLSPPVDPSPLSATVQPQKGSNSNRYRAFRPYSRPDFAKKRHGMGGQSMIRRLHDVLKRIHIHKVEEQQLGLAKTTSNQMLHMISERKRREKLNESFQALRSLLPHGTKKDKASVLATAKDYLNQLKAQINDLEARNRMLEAQTCRIKDEEQQPELILNELVRVRAMNSPRSTPGIRHVELMVVLGMESDIVDVILSILLCMKEMGDISIESMEANGYTRSTKQALLHLQIKGNDWDEEAFKETIKRAVQTASR